MKRRFRHGAIVSFRIPADPDRNAADTPMDASRPPDPEIVLAGKTYRLQKRSLGLPDGPFPHWLPAYDEVNFQSLTASERLRDEAWPYWLEDWPASWGLAAIGLERASDPAHYPMADLGCGSGWLACALSRSLRGPYHAFDFNADACRLGALNLRLLHQEAGSAEWVRSASSAASPFPSRDPSAPSEPSGWVRFCCADAHALPVRFRYRTIFGGEMLYHPEARDAAILCLSGRLHEQGTAYFADSGRSPADPFAEMLVRSGFTVSTEKVERPGHASRWRVFVVRRNRPFGVERTARS